MSTVDNPSATSGRKVEHLQICLTEDVQARGISVGFESYRFIHQALPEIDLDEVNITTKLFGKKVGAPILISSMTGGADWAARINRNLAIAAGKYGLPMGVGSQRAAVENPDLAYSYQIREYAPDVPLLANLGAVQFNYGYGVKQCLEAVRMLEADIMILHLNALQEAVQPAGNTNFKGLLAKISSVCEELAKSGIPVVVKEVGNGLSLNTCKQLWEAGVKGLDVAGSGGTSWSQVETYRIKSKVERNAAENFADWGIPTTQSVIWAREAAPEATVIASGGVRSGVDVAKAIVLGADIAGMAIPFLKAAEDSAEAVEAVIEQLIRELRITMFCIGASNLSELRQTPNFIKLN